MSGLNGLTSFALDQMSERGQTASERPIWPVFTTQVENQSYTRHESGYFSCSVYEKDESDHPAFFRGSIYLSGQAFPVFSLSAIWCTGLVCIPSSIEHMEPWLPDVRKPYGFIAVAFESRSLLLEMDLPFLINSHARSICVPASVQSLAGHRAPRGSSLELLTFEFGSQLRGLDRQIFASGTAPDVIFPASLECIHGLTFFVSKAHSNGHDPIYGVEAGNLHFVVVNSTLMNFARTAVVRSFDPVSVVSIDSMVEELRARCFAWHRMTDFHFAEPSRLVAIRSQAFTGCDCLTSITIPSSVTTIEGRAFAYCSALRDVWIATKSQLEYIGKEAFWEVHWLFRPVDVPSSTRIEGTFEIEAQVFDVDGSRRKRVRFRTRFVFDPMAMRFV
jgi:hypothetical protein